jgi:DUF1365 family protein
MHSCLYQGYVQHRRLSPAKHVFRYGLYLAYLDLDELPALLNGRSGLGQAAFAPASFRRTDRPGDPQTPLADAVRNLVEERAGWRPVGPIRLLTLLRNWGYYFCYCEGGFRERTIGDVQILLTKPACRRAPFLAPLSL